MPEKTNTVFFQIPDTWHPIIGEMKTNGGQTDSRFPNRETSPITPFPKLLSAANCTRRAEQLETRRSLIVSPVNTETNFNCCPSESFPPVGLLQFRRGLIVKKATVSCITVAVVSRARQLKRPVRTELFSSG